MHTKITINPSFAIEAIRKGEIAAFPTETVYGLGASIFSTEAVQKVFQVKGRPQDNPVIAHVSSIEQALSLIERVPPHFLRLIKQFWPGPLALIVEKKGVIPSTMTAGRSTLAIRMPNHAIAREIIEGVGEPLAAPSANISGRPSPTTARHVFEDFEGKIPVIIDGGPCSIGIESTVLSLVHPEPTLLRPGFIRLEELEEAMQCKVSLAKEGQEVLSPGMKYKHYAPRAKISLIYQVEDLKGSYILAKEEIPGKNIRPLSHQTFYGALREADQLGIEEIEIYCDPLLRSDRALWDRIVRASEGAKGTEK